MAQLIITQKNPPSVMHMERASDSSDRDETEILTLALKYHENGFFFTKNTSQDSRQTFLGAQIIDYGRSPVKTRDKSYKHFRFPKEINWGETRHSKVITQDS
jgi:hypothetical protein